METSSKGLVRVPVKRRPVARLLAATLPLVASVLPAGRAAAQPASDAPRISASAEVSILGVDVVVTGRDGKRVTGLAPEDFEVLYSGRRVAITNFHEERSLGTQTQAVAPAGATAPPDTAERSPAAAARLPRRVVVFVDQLYLPEPVRRQKLFAGLEDLLTRSIGPGDEAMVVAYGDRVRVARSFTGDLAALHAAIDVVARSSARLDPEQAELDELAARDSWFGGLESGAGAAVGSTDLSREIAAEQKHATMKGKTAALRGLVALMAGMEGRKSLVLVTDRFGRQQGAAGGARNALPLLDELADAANRSGVTIYGVFTDDLVVMPSAADRKWQDFRDRRTAADAKWMDAMSGLGYVTERTGGDTAGHPGALPGLVDEVVQDLGSFYSIGFPASGATRLAAVKVRVKRPGLTTRTRASLGERTAEERMSDRVLANLFAPDADPRIRISVVAGEAKASGTKFRIPLEVRVPMDALVRVPGAAASRGKFSVFVVAATPSGDFSEVTRKRQEVSVSPGEEAKAAGSHVTYSVEVECDTPAPRISVAVWDEIGGEAGFALVGRRKG